MRQNRCHILRQTLKYLPRIERIAQRVDQIFEHLRYRMVPRKHGTEVIGERLRFRITSSPYAPWLRASKIKTPPTSSVILSGTRAPEPNPRAPNSSSVISRVTSISPGG